MGLQEKSRIFYDRDQYIQAGLHVEVKFEDYKKDIRLGSYSKVFVKFLFKNNNGNCYSLQKLVL